MYRRILGTISTKVELKNSRTDEPFGEAKEALGNKGKALNLQYQALIDHYEAPVRLLAHSSAPRDVLECAS